MKLFKYILLMLIAALLFIAPVVFASNMRLKMTVGARQAGGALYSGYYLHFTADKLAFTADYITF